MGLLTVLIESPLEGLMRCHSSLILLIVASFFVLSCGQPVTQTGTVDVKFDDTVDFTQFQTFSVLTSDIVPPEDVPQLDPEQVAFNDMVNTLIIQAMQAEPVCLTLIPPDEVTPEKQPDLWAANGLGRSTDGGYYYQCVGGWWWGYWGWYWDPCASWYPVYVEYEVGSLLIPVGPPPIGNAKPTPIFAGLAQSIITTGADTQAKVRNAVQQIFAQWPDKRSCSPN
ncbi:MAG: DUF4136 domain-containing protein [Polyangiales bacterium]